MHQRGCAMSTGGYLLAGQVSGLERLELQSRAWEPAGRAIVHTLPPGHPYRRRPVEFSMSPGPRWLRLVSRGKLEELRRCAEAEIAAPGRRGTTYNLVLTWAEVTTE